MSFLTALTIWIVIGLIASFMQLFVYFRGPAHMLEIYKYYKLGNVKNIDDVSHSVFTIVFLIFGMLSGPIAIYTLLKSFYRFSINPPTPVVKEKNESE